MLEQPSSFTLDILIFVSLHNNMSNYKPAEDSGECCPQGVEAMGSGFQDQPYGNLTTIDIGESEENPPTGQQSSGSYGQLESGGAKDSTCISHQNLGTLQSPVMDGQQIERPAKDDEKGSLGDKRSVKPLGADDEQPGRDNPEGNESGRLYNPASTIK